MRDAPLDCGAPETLRVPTSPAFSGSFGPGSVVVARATMGKVNVAKLRYMSRDDFRVLTAVRS